MRSHVLNSHFLCFLSCLFAAAEPNFRDFMLNTFGGQNSCFNKIPQLNTLEASRKMQILSAKYLPKLMLIYL